MTHINQRRDTAANWTTANPVLQLGEVGWETNTRKSKLGDGVTAWNALAYSTAPAPDLSLYALRASPAFTGNPTAPTPATADNDTSIATTQFVKAQNYAPKTSPVFTGNPTAPTPATSDNDTSIATTQFVKAQAYAPLASPALTGNPTAPTPATADNDTSIATTKFVKDQNYSVFSMGTYTPTVGGVVGLAGTGRWSQVGPNVGGLVHVEYFIPITSGGGGSNQVSISLPPGMTAQREATADVRIVQVGLAGVMDTGTRFYTGVPLVLATATQVAMVQDDGTIWMNNTPLVFANTDKLTGSFSFMRAS